MLPPDFRWPLIGRLQSLAQILGLSITIAGLSTEAPAATVPDPRSTVGAWSALAPWPLIPIHMVMTRDGRIMSYGTNAAGRSSGYFIYDIWKPSDGLNGDHLTLPNGTNTNIFCSAQVLMPQSGDILIAGGDSGVGDDVDNIGVASSTVLRNADKTLVKGADMNRVRWYATTTSLPNGEVYIQGGDQGGDFPEVRSRGGKFRLLTGAATSSVHWSYPRNWVAPDGRIFGVSNNAMYYVDWRGTGKFTSAGTMPGSFGTKSTEAMYAPGKILRVGGGPTSSVASANLATIDINGSSPVVKSVEKLPYGLHWSTATILPDGKVVVTGGSLASNKLTGVNSKALIWDPATERWTQGASTSSGKARLYHSTAILLYDGSVLVGGGGAPGPQTNTNVELYYPPYMFRADGQRLRRPRILASPSSLKVGTDFTLTVDDGAKVGRVTLVKTGSVTHSFNMDQRFMELPFTRDGNVLSVKAPTKNTIATPGFYMLFVLDKQGVPSLAKIKAMYVTAS
ncbi:MAG TPA: galactose oxidase early set domain-containing protein [Geminicoccus sp.]|uniref:galactose oxidase early set domain-containing protein n=1 Tax=Geminicoccus sp. TaxID=2024832 RepID=UPI002E2F0712|nr:galactose oxidase early set domain-containing protein [Geminicoccus sp.]HEX2528228.1 galactose oxidase early set domain-containing protein [Geminicoccus sp.]